MRDGGDSASHKHTFFHFQGHQGTHQSLQSGNKSPTWAVSHPHRPLVSPNPTCTFWPDCDASATTTFYCSERLETLALWLTFIPHLLTCGNAARQGSRTHTTSKKAAAMGLGSRGPAGLWRGQGHKPPSLTRDPAPQRPALGWRGRGRKSGQSLFQRPWEGME